MTSLDRINYLNIALMLLSATIAYFFPFELFLLAYALLGPLHYLTEISWLHDRQYFSKGKKDFLILSVLSVIAVYYARLGMSEWVQRFDPLILAFAFAVPFAFIENLALRAILILSAFPLAYSLTEYSPALILFSIFLPTLIHVFAFTWIFVLLGASKTHSRSGYLSAAVMMGLAVTLLMLPPPPSFQLRPYVDQNIHSFGMLHLSLAQVLGWDPQSTAPYSAMRFIGFAYTYHYLNWFSKTKVIEWHKTSKIRLGFISLLYLGFIFTYWYDYATGLKTLALLSLGHVILEFPLNMKSFQGLGMAFFPLIKKESSPELATLKPIFKSKRAKPKATFRHSRSKERKGN